VLCFGNPCLYFKTSILPEEYSNNEIKETGSTRFDKFYKDKDKYYHEKNKYNNETKKWEQSTSEINDFEKYFSTPEKND
jgi:hypothetical protein